MRNPQIIQLYIESTQEFEKKIFTNNAELADKINYYFNADISEGELNEYKALSTVESADKLIHNNSLGINY